MFSPEKTDAYIRMGEPGLYPRGPLPLTPATRTIQQAKMDRLDRLDRQAKKEQTS